MTSYEKKQIRNMLLIAAALMVATIAIVKAEEPKDFCKQYYDYAKQVAQKGKDYRYEYTTAKRMAKACSNSQRSGKSIQYYMELHEQNDTNQEQMIDKGNN